MVYANASDCLAKQAASEHCLNAGATLTAAPAISQREGAWLPCDSQLEKSPPLGAWYTRRPNSGAIASRWSKISDWIPSYATQAVVAVKQYTSSGRPSGV